MRTLFRRWTVGAAIDFAVRKFPAFSSPRLEAEALLSALLDHDRAWLKTHSDFSLSLRQEFQFRRWIFLRRRGVPLAYVVGFKEWAGLRLVLTRQVLIPRDETEILLEHITHFPRKFSPETILDLGTGSGNLAIALAGHFPQSFVTAVDRFSAPLRVAQKNARAQAVSLKLTQSDLLSAFPDGSSWDIIVANLPYLPEDLLVSPAVKKEPRTALFSGGDGLDHLRRLRVQLSQKNIQFRELWLEFLPSQKEAISAMFSSAGNVEFFPDAGGDVFFACVRP